MVYLHDTKSETVQTVADKDGSPVTRLKPGVTEKKTIDLSHNGSAGKLFALALPLSGKQL